MFNGKAMVHTGKFWIADINRRNVCGRGTPVEKILQCLKLTRGAFRVDQDRSVGFIADPTGYADAGRGMLRIIPKPHTLHAPVYPRFQRRRSTIGPIATTG